MATYVVTGGTRGIGFGLVRALTTKPTSEVAKVFATGRKTNDTFNKLVSELSGRLEFVTLEISDKAQVEAAVKTVERSLGGKGLDVLINNAGISARTPQGIEKMSSDLESHFAVNVVGTHNVSSAFLPLLKKGEARKIINITSSLGSMGLSHLYKYPFQAYKISKAALNMLTTQWSEAFEGQGFTILAVCPGFVKTELTGDMADLTVEQSANGIVEIIDGKMVKDTGKFFVVRVPGWENKTGTQRYHGGEQPW